MFYANFVNLCNSIGKAPSAVAVEMGFQKSVVTRWKNGSTPTDANVNKIADYFGVTTAYLLGEEGKEALSFDDFTYALHNESGDLTEEDKALLLQMARQLAEKNKNGGKTR